MEIGQPHEIADWWYFPHLHICSSHLDNSAVHQQQRRLLLVSRVVGGA